MKVNFNVALRDAFGEIILRDNPRKLGEDGKPLQEPMLAKHAVIDALTNAQLTAAYSGDDKVKIWRDVQKIAGSTGEIDLRSENVARIKELLAKTFGPIVVGQVYDIIDPPENSNGPAAQ